MLYFFLHVHAGYIRATTTALAVPMSGKKRTKKGKTVTATSQLKKLSTWPDSSKRKIKLSYETATKDDKELLEKIFEWNEFDVQSEDLLSLNGDVSVYGWQHVVNFALFEKYNFLLPLLKEYLTSSARKGGLEDSFDSLRDDQHGLKDFVYVYCTMLTLILRKQEPEEQAIGLIMDALEEVFGPSLEGRLEADDGVKDAFDNYIKTLPPPPDPVPPPVPPAPARRPSGRSPPRRSSGSSSGRSPPRRSSGSSSGRSPPRRSSGSSSGRSPPRRSSGSSSGRSSGRSSGSSSSRRVRTAWTRRPLVFKQVEVAAQGGTSWDFGVRKPSTATVVANDGGGLCGYFAFGQWLQEYRGMNEAETQCNALRTLVADFNLMNNTCGITNNDEFLAAQARARAANAGATENWMTDVELKILACIFNVCVIVYKDYRSTGTYRSSPQVITELNAVTYTVLNDISCNDAELQKSDKTLWLRNTLLAGGSTHYELLIDVEFKTK